MAVAGKAQIQTQGGEVVILAEQVQRAGQPQAQLVATWPLRQNRERRTLRENRP
jgi:hypothetical protein